ncbi:MAG: SDR family oxidoreductase [Eubacteriales bacterium]|nr:SDR family oxidoreductase [Eubacteriales bacterium]
MKNLFDLSGKVAVVVGASSGLGADAARGFADAGADVALLARRTEKTEAVAEEVRGKGRKALAVACDVTSEESVRAAIEAVMSAYGKIDILLNNAGVAVRGGVDGLSLADWNKSLETNLTGIYLVCKYVVPHMKEAGYGKIINTASINALVADKNDLFIRHGYNASKAGVIGLTRGMAASYSRYGITVNAVGPGLFESEMTQSTLFQSQEFLAMYSQVNPAGRPAKRGELNGPLIFLASDASSYVTGQILYVDGGFSVI